MSAGSPAGSAPSIVSSSSLIALVRRMSRVAAKSAAPRKSSAVVTSGPPAAQPPVRMPDAGSVADRVATRQEHKLLLRGLRELPLELQTLVELAYWEGLSDRELADVAEVAPGTVKSRLRKARQLLEQELTRLAPTPQLLASTQQSLRAWADGIRAKTGIEGGQGRR